MNHSEAIAEIRSIISFYNSDPDESATNAFGRIEDIIGQTQDPCGACRSISPGDFQPHTCQTNSYIAPFVIEIIKVKNGFCVAYPALSIMPSISMSGNIWSCTIPDFANWISASSRIELEEEIEKWLAFRLEQYMLTKDSLADDAIQLRDKLTKRFKFYPSSGEGD